MQENQVPLYEGDQNDLSVRKEIVTDPSSGIGMCLGGTGMCLSVGLWIALAIVLKSPIFFAFMGIAALAGMCMFCGIYTVNPNDAKVLMLCGEYKGTIKQNGLFWVNPCYTKMDISLRAHNLQGSVIKVNDRGGNPIEIAVVVVW